MNFGNHEEFDFPIQKFEQMLKTNEVLFFDTQDFENIITFYLDVGKVALAKKAMKIGLEQHPNTPSLLLLKADLLMFEEKYEESLELLNELKKVEPTNDEVYVLIANVYSKQEKHLESIHHLKLAAQLTNDAEDIYHLIGMEYLMLEMYEEAKENFILSLNEEYDDYATLYNIVYCFEFLDQRVEAKEFLNDFIDENPYCQIAWHHLGLIYAEEGDFQQALDCFEYAIISDEYFVGAYLEKAKILEKLNRYHDAIELYQVTLQIDDPTAFAYYRLGKCYQKVQDSANALRSFKKAVHEDPLMDRCWLALTDFCIEHKDYEKALHYINKALHIDEENENYWKKYVIVCSKLGMKEEVINAHIKINNLHFIDLSYYISHADLLISEDLWYEAEHLLREGLNYFQNNHEILYRLGALELMLEKESNALDTFYLAYKISPAYLDIMPILFPSLTETEDYKTMVRILKQEGFSDEEDVDWIS